eukprot:CAMPEP_0113691682 /NCGR_PEP_ID=MMETSP0038_2-20120614/18605_1 /TAXON_ID=2898 /ORGANISM="Cryptomonas paramecium" /LENGTH=206 /DNA_ID=CAMNT_0000613391 /DNA_START=16 /DNA_END=633 /DNA_ORIENTATION=+ /assembly_acc=CAM_ASM_000170
MAATATHNLQTLREVKADKSGAKAWLNISQVFDDEFSLDRVEEDSKNDPGKGGFNGRRASWSDTVQHSSEICASVRWYSKLDINWCGFLKKKDRGPLTMWRRRWFELRQPFLKPNSTFPILIYMSKSLQKDKVLRVKDVRHSIEGPGHPLVLTMDVVESTSEFDVDQSPCRQMIVSIPDEAKSSHFHTILLMMLEAARRYRRGSQE